MSALSDSQVEHWGAYLFEAATDGNAVQAITASVDLSTDDAYRIQANLVRRHLAAGDRVVGAKAGLTSLAKQVQMGVDSPIFGVITERMKVAVGDPVLVGTRIHPRCEPEIVFLMGDELSGDVDEGDVLDATSAIHGGIEIIDSRYEKFSFTLPDVIADNTSASGFVIGSVATSPRSLPLADIRCVFGDPTAERVESSGAALLGNPATCVVELVRHLSRWGQSLPAGAWVLAGATTDAVPLTAGTTVRADFPDLDDTVTVNAR